MEKEESVAMGLALVKGCLTRGHYSGVMLGIDHCSLVIIITEGPVVYERKVLDEHQDDEGRGKITCGAYPPLIGLRAGQHLIVCAQEDPLSLSLPHALSNKNKCIKSSTNFHKVISGSDEPK